MFIQYALLRTKKHRCVTAQLSPALFSRGYFFYVSMAFKTGLLASEHEAALSLSGRVHYSEVVEVLIETDREV